MDELIGFVSKKTGLSPENARAAADAVITFIKDRLPPGLSSQLDQVVSGEGAGGTLDKVTKGLGGLLGK